MQLLHKIGRYPFTRIMLIFVLSVIASFSMPLMAEDDAYQLIVKMKNNDDKAFLLAKKPVVTFTATECVIDYEDFTGYFNMGEIQNITINKSSGLNEAISDKVTLDYTDANTVIVRGLPAAAVVTLHTLNGILIDSVSADSEGNARINMAAVNPASVCIISVNSTKNFKIYKK